MTERFFLTHERFAYEVGRDYGTAAGSNTQAQLLNGLFEALSKIGGGPGLQMAYIVNDLTPAAKNLIQELALYIKED